MFRFGKTPLRRGVAYYRHSAEDKQEFSVAIQRELTEKFAQANNIQIIHEEADEGETGLNANRPGFQRLFDEWITDPNAPNFEYILVLDVTRWGRFQDLNEPAHYEYICTKNGKEVIYVSRGFPKDTDKLAASIVTSVERFEAARFSARLSEKVFYGSVNISKQGYSVGGTASYGLVRLLLDENKQPVGVLKKGQHKAISNARVTFVPAKDGTAEVVQEIFDDFVNKFKNIENIVQNLNSGNVTSPSGKKWQKETILRILSNEVYIGTRVYNKTWHKLKQGHRRNPRSEWVITPNSFPAIISHEVFSKAQERLYWLMPTRWKRGIYAIRKAQKLLQQELCRLFTTQGINIAEIDGFTKNFPILYGVSFLAASSVSRWCFLIPSYMRRYQYVLAVGIKPDHEDIIEQIFFMPTNEFNREDFQVFTAHDPMYIKYRLSEERAEENILSLLHEVQTILR